MAQTPALGSSDVGDLDGDGDVDVLLSRGTTWTLLNDGTGRFEATGYTFNNVVGVELADLDGDGDLDAYAANPQDTVLFNQGDGTFDQVASGLPSGAPLRDANLVDLDMDGDLDVVRITFFGQLQFGLNDGQGRFSVGSGFLGGAGPMVDGILVGDWNGDGAPGVMLTSRSAPAQLFESSPQGLTLSTTFMTGLTGVVGAVAEDFNGDGHRDIVLTRGASLVELYFGDGAGGFVSGGSVAIQHPSGALELGDFDLDGDQDLCVVGPIVLGPALDEASILLNDGLGNFVDETAMRLAPGSGLSSSVHARDFDGDGDLDLYLDVYGLATTQADGLVVNHHRQVSVPRPATVGGSLDVACSAEPGYASGVRAALLMLGPRAASPLPVVLAPGMRQAFHIEPGLAIPLPFLSLVGPAGVGQVVVPIPNDPILANTEVLVQGLIVDVLGGRPPELTGFEAVEIR